MISYLRAFCRCLFHMEKYRLFKFESSDGTIVTGCVTDDSFKQLMEALER